jgi:hypothetical protein
MSIEELRFTPKVPVQKIRGVYLLWNLGTVVYVGQSENILQRVGIHLANPLKNFDGFSYAVIESGDLNDIEADLIVRYQTRINKDLPKNKKYVTARYLRKQGFGGWEIRRILKRLHPVWRDYYLASDFEGAR